MQIAIITDKLNSHGDLTNGVRIFHAFARLGYKVSLVGHDDVFDSCLTNADLILLMGTAIYDRNIHQIKQISEIKKEGSILALWHFDACNPYFAHCKHKYAKINSIIKHLDWLITTDNFYDWASEAKNYMHLMQGIEENDFIEEQDYQKAKEYDVIFTGGITKYFGYRGVQIKQIEEKYNIDAYGNNYNRYIYRKQFAKAYHNARVALVPQPFIGMDRDYWSNRIYLATATGTPCVVGHVNGIEKHFIPSKEILTFKSNTEMMSRIKYLIDNPDRAKSIGEAGRARTLQEHKYTDRVEKMMSRINPGGMKWKQ